MFAAAARFVHRHAWSLPLGTLSLVAFVRLARELGAGELGPLDAWGARTAAAARGHADGPMLALTQTGDPLVMGALGVTAYTLLLARRRPREAWFVAAGAGGAALLNTALKLVFHRARPDPSARYLVDAPASFSFPSGHAMGSAGVLASIVIALFALRVPRRLRYSAVAVAATVAGGVAASRVYLGVHYLSDVVGGELGAAAWVSAVAGVFYPRLLPGEASEAAAPPA